MVSGATRGAKPSVAGSPATPSLSQSLISKDSTPVGGVEPSADGEGLSHSESKGDGEAGALQSDEIVIVGVEGNAVQGERDTAAAAAAAAAEAAAATEAAITAAAEEMASAESHSLTQGAMKLVYLLAIQVCRSHYLKLKWKLVQCQPTGC